MARNRRDETPEHGEDAESDPLDVLPDGRTPNMAGTCLPDRLLPSCKVEFIGPPWDTFPMAHQERDPAEVVLSPDNAARDHMANTRTLLAWLRTAIALIGLGFVVARFGLFLRELGASASNSPNQSSSGVSALVGVGVVLIGVLLVALSMYRFLDAKKQIDHGRFEVKVRVEVAAGIATLAAGLALAGYLIVNR